MPKPKSLKIGTDCIGGFRRQRSPHKKSKSSIKKVERWLKQHRNEIITKAGSTAAETVVMTAFPYVATMIYGTTFLPPIAKNFVLNLIRKAFAF